MTIKDDSKDLNNSFDETRGKMRKLTDDMKLLSSEGMEKLSKTVTQSITVSRQTATRQPSEAIIGSELSKFLKQEMMSGLGGLFGGKGKSAGTGQSGGFGGGELNVIVNNSTPYAVTARETSGAFNQKTLEIMIDQMVADSLMRGRQTSGVLNSMFGLSPNLIGR